MNIIKMNYENQRIDLQGKSQCELTKILFQKLV